MDTSLWAKAHGATTHFPIALALVSAVCDGAGLIAGGRPVARELQAAGRWTMVAGALGSVGAVASGLLLTKGSVLGHDTLRMHHLFVWPAFTLLVALATWRLAAGRAPTRRALAAYLTVTVVMAGLVAAAGYYGGETIVAA